MHCDDIEQYGKRLCLRVDDMPSIQNETPCTVEDELRKEFNSMEVNIPHHSIDRTHRIGKIVKYKRRRRWKCNWGDMRTARALPN